MNTMIELRRMRRIFAQWSIGPYYHVSNSEIVNKNLTGSVSRKNIASHNSPGVILQSVINGEIESATLFAISCEEV